MADENKALYHCNHCKKNITETIQIKCVTCADFELCVECFKVGDELAPHKNDHPYRVMGSLGFLHTNRDWSAYEEMSLVEGLETFDLYDWPKVAEHVGTKNAEQCSQQKKYAYFNSQSQGLLPNFSYIKEVLAMVKGQCIESVDIKDPQTGNEDSSLVIGHDLINEYDKDIEKLLGDIDCSETDTDDKRELKLRITHIYNKM